jgi:hypothetical protein
MKRPMLVRVLAGALLFSSASVALAAKPLPRVKPITVPFAKAAGMAIQDRLLPGAQVMQGAGWRLRRMGPGGTIMGRDTGRYVTATIRDPSGEAHLISVLMSNGRSNGLVVPMGPANVIWGRLTVPIDRSKWSPPRYSRRAIGRP